MAAILNIMFYKKTHKDEMKLHIRPDTTLGEPYTILAKNYYFYPFSLIRHCCDLEMTLE